MHKLLLWFSKAADEKDGKLIVESVEHKKLSAFTKDIIDEYKEVSGKKRKYDDDGKDTAVNIALAKHPKREDLKKGDDVVEEFAVICHGKGA